MVYFVLLFFSWNLCKQINYTIKTPKNHFKDGNNQLNLPRFIFYFNIQQILRNQRTFTNCNKIGRFKQEYIIIHNYNRSTQCWLLTEKKNGRCENLRGPGLTMHCPLGIEFKTFGTRKIVPNSKYFKLSLFKQPCSIVIHSQRLVIYHI